MKKGKTITPSKHDFLLIKHEILIFFQILFPDRFFQDIHLTPVFKYNALLQKDGLNYVDKKSYTTIFFLHTYNEKIWKSTSLGTQY